MRNLLWSLLAAGMFGVVIAGCSEDNPVEDPTPVEFTVTITNLSTTSTLATDRANGMIPLSPGAYAVYTGDNPMFTVGGTATAGMELIAEDGVVETTLNDLEGTERVSESGSFMGPDGPILSGESATFKVIAFDGDRLQFATMFVQSNDWFYAFEGNGLDLFNNGTAISGDVTASVRLYDGGTEEDTAPGTGEYQKPAQAMDEINVGPADDNTMIRLASEDGFQIPAKESVIRVTITPEG